MKKFRAIFFSSLKKVLVFSVVLLVMYSAFGVFYTWYIGKDEVVTDESQLVESTQKTTTTPITHVQQDPNANVGASVQYTSTPLKPGSEASLSVRTNSFATCDIKFTYKDNIDSKSEGLITKTADDYGSVDWHWIVDKDAPIGEWPVTVTCRKNTKSGVVISRIKIE